MASVSGSKCRVPSGSRARPRTAQQHAEAPLRREAAWLWSRAVVPDLLGSCSLRGQRRHGHRMRGVTESSRPSPGLRSSVIHPAQQIGAVASPFACRAFSSSGDATDWACPESGRRDRLCRAGLPSCIASIQPPGTSSAAGPWWTAACAGMASKGGRCTSRRIASGLRRGRVAGRAGGLVPVALIVRNEAFAGGRVGLSIAPLDPLLV
jgi:hypothetical protein